ncbi:MAG: enolase [Lentimonas sp.]|jgi:enolase
MKTTLNIPEKQMITLLKVTKAKTKTEAINKAIEEYIYQENVKALLALEGSSTNFMTQDELQELRNLELAEQQNIEPLKQ